jgi:hypothetical protein
VAYACRIDCVTLEGPEGRIVSVGIVESDGSRSSFPAAELIRAIETGDRTCYVTLGGHSHLVVVSLDGSGEKTLATLVGELAALRLPHCG